jgi:hypothetical protein
MFTARWLGFSPIGGAKLQRVRERKKYSSAGCSKMQRQKLHRQRQNIIDIFFNIRK